MAVQSGFPFSDKCSDDSPIPNPVRTLRRSLSADGDVRVGFGCGRNAGNQRFDAGEEAGRKQNNAQETCQLIGKAFKPPFLGAQCNHQQDARRGGKEFAQENGARARAAENRLRPGRTNSGSVNPGALSDRRAYRKLEHRERRRHAPLSGRSWLANERGSRLARADPVGPRTEQRSPAKSRERDDHRAGCTEGHVAHDKFAQRVHHHRFTRAGEHASDNFCAASFGSEWSSPSAVIDSKESIFI